MEGKVAQLEIASGDPLLAPLAIEAMKQWRYRHAAECRSC